MIIAAPAGEHVISEKPFTTTVAEAERALAACPAAKVKHSIGYRLHFDPFHQELKRLAREKDFGVLAKMTGANGFRIGKKVWRGDFKLAGGGPLRDMGVYCVQAACMAADGATPVAVTVREPLTPASSQEIIEERPDRAIRVARGPLALAGGPLRVDRGPVGIAAARLPRVGRPALGNPQRRLHLRRRPLALRKYSSRKT